MRAGNSMHPLIELLLFELEKVWPAPYLGLVLALLTLGAPVNAGPVHVPSSLLEAALLCTGGAGQLLLAFVASLTFANSFGRDLEQDILFGELTLPLRKEDLFAVKVTANYSVILLADFASALFSTWLSFASLSFTSAASVVLAHAAYSLLYVSVTILACVVLKSRFGALIVAVSTYFLESVLLLSVSVSTGRPPDLDPVVILLKLILLREVTSYTWSIVLAHVLFPIALLLAAYLYFVKVMELD